MYLSNTVWPAKNALSPLKYISLGIIHDRCVVKLSVLHVNGITTPLIAILLNIFDVSLALQDVCQCTTCFFQLVPCVLFQLQHKTDFKLWLILAEHFVILKLMSVVFIWLCSLMTAAFELHGLCVNPDDHVLRQDLRMSQRASCALKESRTSNHLYKRVHITSMPHIYLFD